MVGKSIPTDTEHKCWVFVIDYDTKPKRWLAELFKTQRMVYNLDQRVAIARRVACV
jgi:hypothetical protein